MIGWIIGGLILYNIIGFIYGLIMLLIIVSEDHLDEQREFDHGGSRCLLLLICTTCWIILIPSVIIYRIYIKFKGGN